MRQFSNKPKSNPPISRHPLFPAMVALWFGALLGLGSLAIRLTLLERAILALRLDLVVPAAAPPLGMTARIILALGLFALGAAMGFLIGWRIRHSGTDQGSRAVAGNTVDRPAEVVSGKDYGLAGRRRSLTIEEDYSLHHYDLAPLPGGAAEILDLASLGAIETHDHGDDADAGHAGADDFHAAEPDEADPQPVARFAPEAAEGMSAAHAEEAPHVAFEEAPQADEPAVEVATASPARFAAPVATTVADQPGHETESARRFAAPSWPEIAPAAEEPLAAFARPVEPVVVEEHRVEQVELWDRPQADEAASVAHEQTSEPASVSPRTVEPAGLGLVSRDAAEKLVSAPVESLGVVELAERLAMAIARKRGVHVVSEPVAAAPMFAAPPKAEPAADDAVADPVVEQEPAPAAPAARPFSAPSLPAAMRPLTFDEHDADDDDPIEALLPPRRFAALAPVPAPIQPASEPVAQAPLQSEAAPAVEDPAEAEFGSLLDMKVPPRQTFERIDDSADQPDVVEPVVIFPGEGAAPGRFSRPADRGNAAAAPRWADPQVAPLAPAQPVVPGALPAAGLDLDPAETERALKTALATLQRMSGAA